MTAYQARIDNISPDFAPEEYEPSSGLTPPKDFVVSRNLDGSPLSRYGDLVWDWTPYSARKQSSKMNFKFWDGDRVTEQQTKLTEQIRWLMFVMLWLRRGPPLNFGILKNYMLSLRHLAKNAESNNVSVKDILENPVLLVQSVPPSVTMHVASILETLVRLDPESTGFEFDIAESLSVLRERVKSYQKDLKQTPPMPKRIYAEFLARLSDEVNEYGSIVDNLIALFLEIGVSPSRSTTKRHQVLERNKMGIPEDVPFLPLFAELLSKHGLKEFWDSRNIQSGFRGVISLLCDIQYCLSVQIKAFTGMRSDEARHLPYDCLYQEHRDGDPRPHNVVQGTVTKLTNAKIKRVKWITSDKGHDAVRMAQKIAKAIYKLKGIELKDSLGKDKKKIDEYYLFVTPAYGPYKKKHAPIVLHADNFPHVVEKLSPTLNEDDIEELKKIDPSRAWREEEKFQPGQKWHFTSHQLRRSLAMYAHASGLVSLPSLKRQLQHITEEMTLYYAKGSVHADNFISVEKDEKHFAEEYRETKPISDFLAYTAMVLMSGETDLFGGHGEWSKLRHYDAKGLVLMDREATLKRFKKGEIGFKKTVLGACVSTEPCKVNPINIVPLECLQNNCRNLMGSKRAVENAILVKRKHVQKLHDSYGESVEYRIEFNELQSLETAFANIK